MDLTTKDFIAMMEAAPSRPSMARNFSIRHIGRKRQLHDRQTRASRRLALRGAMEPAGCTLTEMQAVVDQQELRPSDVNAIMDTLWQFRLLGWVQHDAAYCTYTEIVDIVRKGTRRPADTLDLIPAWFAKKRTPEELSRFRYAS